MNALDENDKSKYDELVSSVRALETKLESVAPSSEWNELTPWEDLAHALLTLQEFIYLK